MYIYSVIIIKSVFAIQIQGVQKLNSPLYGGRATDQHAVFSRWHIKGAIKMSAQVT